MTTLPSTAELASSVARTAAFSRVLDVLERRHRWPVHLLPILTYHRVDDHLRTPGLAPGLVSATPAEFDEQMRHIVDNYCVLGMAEVLAARRGGRRLPPRSVVVTFDDAYRDFATHAWPVLRRYAAPVTLFVPTAYPDHTERSFWWDRLWRAVTATTQRTALDSPIGALTMATAQDRGIAFRLLKEHLKGVAHERAMAIVAQLTRQLGVPAASGAVLGWQELRRLADEGVTLAAHSRTHAMLDQVDEPRLGSEVAGSLQDLAEQVGATLPVFAYPSGRHADAVVAALRRAGVELGFTTERGCNDLRSADWLRLRRINVGPRSSMALIRAQLLSTSTPLQRLVGRPQRPSRPPT
ncbi:MAG: polysaccharide deacetylase family protein [Egibacteraceae bacterium]